MGLEALPAHRPALPTPLSDSSAGAPASPLPARKAATAQCSQEAPRAAPGLSMHGRLIPLTNSAQLPLLVAMPGAQEGAARSPPASSAMSRFSAHNSIQSL